MEEETLHCDIAWDLLRNFDVDDAESVQSDHDAGAGAEDCLLVHRAEPASSRLSLGCILSGMF